MKSTYIQGVFFNWYPPKNHKYGKKLKYQNWYPPSNSQVSELVPPPQIHNDAAQKDIDFQVIIMGICMYRDGMNTCFLCQ